jgi:hypothetical protein
LNELARWQRDGCRRASLAHRAARKDRKRKGRRPKSRPHGGLRGSVEGAAWSSQALNEGVSDVLGPLEDFEPGYSEPVPNAQDVTPESADQPEDPTSEPDRSDAYEPEPTSEPVSSTEIPATQIESEAGPSERAGFCWSEITGMPETTQNLEHWPRT